MLRRGRGDRHSERAETRLRELNSSQAKTRNYILKYTITLRQIENILFWQKTGTTVRGSIKSGLRWPLPAEVAWAHQEKPSSLHP